jgi:hypothetical protein
MGSQGLNWIVAYEPVLAAAPHVSARPFERHRKRRRGSHAHIVI